MNTSSVSGYTRRKKVVKWFLILMAVLFLCVFLSGTLKTFATAKVYTVIPSYGNLQETIYMTGVLHFPDQDCITVPELSDDTAYIIRKIHVAPGMRIQSGDLLAEAVIADYDNVIRSIENDYMEASKELMLLESGYPNLHISSQEENWIHAYEDYLQAEKNGLYADAELSVAKEKSNTENNSFAPNENKDTPDIKALESAAHDTREALAEAKKRLQKADQMEIDPAVKEYLLQKRDIEARMQASQDKMQKIMLAAEAAHEIRAPHDGVVISSDIQEGQICTSGENLFTLNGQSAEPVLLANTEELDRSVAVGTPVEIYGRRGNSINSYISEKTYDSQGAETAVIPVQMSELSDLGSMTTLLWDGVDITAEYKKDDMMLLLPASALRGEDKDYFVYTINETTNLLGQQVYQVKKQPVEVLDMSDNIVAISDDLMMGDTRIAYMEDRGIGEGSEVLVINGER